jgi:hypothetical protein
VQAKANGGKTDVEHTVRCERRDALDQPKAQPRIVAWQQRKREQNDEPHCACGKSGA